MQDTTGQTEVARTRDDWLERLDRIVADDGYLEPLGKRHWAFFVDDGPVLLVTFETVDRIRARLPDQMPQGYDIARRNGWSLLCLIADGATWYRDRHVWGYFDRLVDDAFFDDFDRVTFFGAGMGGYAACAYCVAAPGATVLAIRPRASLSPEVAGWDGRDRAARRFDFTSRYGFGPDMIEGAGRVLLMHDPREAADAMHAALYRKGFVTRLDCPGLGPEPDAALASMRLLDPLVEAACRGTLDARGWARMWRGRYGYGPWLRGMLDRLGAGKSRVREAVFCRAVNARMNAPRFRRRYAELQAQFDALGVTLPPARDAGAAPPGPLPAENLADDGERG